MKITHADVDVMARTLYGEARGEGPEGLRAVGWIIRNRWISRGFGDSLLEVCTARSQFECWQPGNANHRAMIAADLADPLYRVALVATTDVIHELHGDPTRGSLYYKVVGHPSPWFRNALDKGVIAPTRSEGGEHLRIGNHEFYRDARSV